MDLNITIVIDGRFYRFIKKTITMRKLFLGLLLAVVATTLNASELNTFIGGKTIKSSEVNQNFADLDSRITTLETGNFDLATILRTDTISENTTDAGVTIDGVVLKDNGITASGTITASDQISANGGLSATTISVSGQISANGGINVQSGDVIRHNGTTLNGYITTGTSDFPSNSAIKLKVLEIGDWNMFSYSIVTIAHGLDTAKIINAWAVIRGDVGAGDFRNILTCSSSGATGNYSAVRWNATNIDLMREAGGLFRSSTYNATSYNRGWIFIQYI